MLVVKTKSPKVSSLRELGVDYTDKHSNIQQTLCVILTAGQSGSRYSKHLFMGRATIYSMTFFKFVMTRILRTKCSFVLCIYVHGKNVNKLRWNSKILGVTHTYTDSNSLVSLILILIATPWCHSYLH